MIKEQSFHSLLWKMVQFSKRNGEFPEDWKMIKGDLTIVG